MNRNLLGVRRPLALAAGLLAAPMSAADEAPSVQVEPDAQGAAARVTASITIAAPPEIVWRTMLDCDAAPAFVPGLDTCRVLETGPNGAWDVREHRLSWMFLLPASRNVFRSDYEEPRTIRFRRIEGAFEIMEGEWTLKPAEDGRATHVGYEARLSVSVPASGPFVRRAARRNTPKVLTALRAEVLARAGDRP